MSLSVNVTLGESPAIVSEQRKFTDGFQLEDLYVHETGLLNNIMSVSHHNFLSIKGFPETSNV